MSDFMGYVGLGVLNSMTKGSGFGNSFVVKIGPSNSDCADARLNNAGV